MTLAPTPLQLLQLALSRGADIDQLGKLMELQERWERNEARKAFVAAMNAFKAEAPRITKNKGASITPKDSSKQGYNYDYATLDNVCDSVIAGLSKQGISHRWVMAQTAQGWVEVTCILTHALGHSENTVLQGPADLSGGKNPIQAIASTVTYLQRYTLLAATGLAAANTDNDGRGDTSTPAADNYCDRMAKAQSREQLRQIFGEAFRATNDNKRAQGTIIQSYESHKRRLQ